MKNFFALMFVVLVSACSTTGDVVLQRADNLSERPSWASDTVSYFEKDGRANFIGTMSVDGGSSTSWLCMAASNVTKKSVSSLVKQKLDFVTQVAQEDMNLGVNQMKYIGTEASNTVLSNLNRDGCYWEKVLTQKDTNSKSVEYRAFVKMSIPVDELKQAIRSAGAKKGLSQEFSKQVDQRWNEVLEIKREE